MEKLTPADRIAILAKYLPGRSAPMVALRQRLAGFAATDAPIRFEGRTGAGKNHAAEATHHASDRRSGLFSVLNCTATPMFEALLFGHERGAFTSAMTEREGELATVGDGTLLLDEIGDLPLELQPKLLRVLDHGSYRPLGAKRDRIFPGRFFFASHRDLPKRVDSGDFREDLYYRINMLYARVPCLADRPEDIPHLLAGFLECKKIKLTEDASQWVMRQPFKGNAREVKALAEWVKALFVGDRIDVEDLERISRERLESEARATSKSENDRPSIVSVRRQSEENERRLLMDAIRQTGSQRAAAKLLGIDRNQVQRRMRKWTRGSK